jgi:hypothetical protein
MRVQHAVLVGLVYATVTLAGSNGIINRLQKRAITTQQYFDAVDAAEPIELAIETQGRKDRVSPFVTSQLLSKWIDIYTI